MKTKVNNLLVEIYKTREQCGIKSANAIGQKIIKLQKEKESIRMIFAAAPSQNEMLANLIKIDGIDWGRITAFHMDEYVGINSNNPNAFGQYLRDRIFYKVPIKEVNIIETQNKNIEEVCNKYEKKIMQGQIDIICMGIGENGHIAFNDPPYASFNDSKLVKVVVLDKKSRQQQVNDGCFNNINDVPKQAVTLTIPALFAGTYLFAVVPGKTKATAVKNSLLGPITEDCPASILRIHKNAMLFLDSDSSTLIKSKIK